MEVSNTAAIFLQIYRQCQRFHFFFFKQTKQKTLDTIQMEELGT